MARTRSSTSSQSDRDEPKNPSPSTRKSSRQRKKPEMFIPSPSRRLSTAKSSPESIRSRDRFTLSSVTGESSTDGGSDDDFRPSRSIASGARHKRVSGPKPKSKAKPASKKSTGKSHPLIVAVMDKEVAMKTIVRDWIRRYNGTTEAAARRGFVDLLNFFCQTCGSEGNVVEPRTPWDQIDGKLPEIVKSACENIAENLTAKQADQYFANLHTGENKHVAKNFAMFWKLLAALGEEKLIQGTTIKLLIEFLVAASGAGLTSFRHSATIAALSLGISIADRYSKLEQSKDRSSRQFKAEEIKCLKKLSSGDRKAYESRMKQLESVRNKLNATNEEFETVTSQFEHVFGKVRKQFSSKALRLHETLTTAVQDLLGLERVLSSIYRNICSQRYRDIEIRIRTSTLEMFGEWMTKCETLFVDNTHVRKYGWMLNDSEPSVRIASLKVLHRVLSDDYNVQGLSSFLEHIHDRLMEMLHDKNPAVVEQVLDLLRILLPHSVLHDEDLFSAEECLFVRDRDVVDDGVLDESSWSNVRKAAANFAMLSYDPLAGIPDSNYAEEEFEEDEIPDEVRLVGLARLIIDHAALGEKDEGGDAEESGKLDKETCETLQSLVLEQIPQIASSFYQIENGSFVSNWAVGGNLLLEKGFDDPNVSKILGARTQLTDVEARIIIHIMKASAEMIMRSPAVAKSDRRRSISITERNANDERKTSYSNEVLGFLSSVLLKYQSDPYIVGAASYLANYLEFDDISSGTQVKELQGVIGQMVSLLKVQSNEGALLAMASALDRACQTDHSINRFAELRVLNAYKALSERCNELVAESSGNWRSKEHVDADDQISVVTNVDEIPAVKDHEYSLMANLARLSSLERSVELCCKSAIKEDDEGLLISTIDLENLVRARGQYNPKLLGYVEFENEDTSKKGYVRVAGLWDARVYKYALELMLIRSIAKHQQLFALADDVENEQEIQQRTNNVLASRNQLVSHFEEMRNRQSLKELSDSELGDLDEDVLNSIAFYKKLVCEVLTAVYHDLRIVASPRLQDSNTVVRELAWYPSRQLQGYFTNQLEDVVKTVSENSESIQKVVESSSEDPSNLDAEIGILALQSAFHNQVIVPWSRVGIFADPGGRQALASSAQLLQCIAKHKGELLANSIRKFANEWKQYDPKRCMQLHMETLRLGSIEAKRFEKSDGGDRWEQVYSLAETLSRSLGVCGSNKSLAEAVESMVLEGMDFSLSGKGEYFSFLDLLAYYVKYGGYINKASRRRLLKAFWGKLDSVPEKTLNEIEDSRKVTEKEAHAVIDFENLLCKGTEAKPKATFRSENVPEPLAATSSSALQEAEDRDADGVDMPMSDAASTISTPRLSAIEKSRISRKARIAFDASDDDSDGESAPAPVSPQPRKLARTTPETTDDSANEDLERLRLKAEKNVFESDSDDLDTSKTTRRSSRRLSANHQAKHSDQESSQKSGSSGTKRSAQSDGEESAGYASDATNISVIGAKSRRRRASKRNKTS